MASSDERRPGQSAIVLTALAFAGAVALHVDRIPLWCSAIAFAFAAWRGTAAHRRLPLPRRATLVAITIALVIAVLAAFRTLNGLSAGSALLVVMGAVKLLETRTRRDQLIVVFVSLFLLIAACLDRQSLLRLPLYAAHVWLACVALLYIAHPSSPLRAREAAGLTLRSLLYALPLAVALFVLFPRIPGAFWAVPKDHTAVTGLSEEMSPGSITNLVDSDTPVFRVWFDEMPPPPQLRYWRGPVLHDFDGYTWRRTRASAPPPRLVQEGVPVTYRVRLEPDMGPWWFALELPARSPSRRVFFTWDYQLVAPESLNQLQYRVESYPRARSLDTLSLTGRRIDSRLPEGRNERTRLFAQRLRAEVASDAAFSHAVLEHFRTRGFEYTLTPPRLDLDSVDDFLFNTRRGFCGHFASAYVTLMRAGGVPARVVTGYLGGEWNPIGRHFTVRQSDAHAWAEIWLEGRGWTRIDPTGVVSPERLMRGLFDVLPESASLTTRIMRRTSWLARPLHAWDALNAWWNDKVVGFDFDAQLNLLEKLGIDSASWQHLALALAAATGAWLAWIALRLSRLPPRGPPDRLARAYVRLCRKLARAGYSRQAHEGPSTFAARLENSRPLATLVRPLISRYAALRFGAPSREHEQAVAAFARDVARVRVRHTGRGPRPDGPEVTTWNY
jgi:transglutaminase-like putative cysteine protease